MNYPSIDITGAVVAVTGGGRGIGRATAERFAAHRAKVWIGDLDADVAASTAAEIGGTGLPLDVTSAESFGAFVAAILDRHGRIDVLVNNAGIMPLGDFLTEDPALSRATMDVNVFGLIHGMRTVLPGMIERRRGHVVNVASMAGKLAVPGLAVYNASKFAAVGLSAAVREEYRDTGVSVTTVLPSAVRTRLATGVPLGKGMPTVDPADVAEAIVGSLANRPAEITVPGYLAGWDLLQAAVPEPVMRLGRRLIGDRRGLTDIDHERRRDYADSLTQQAMPKQVRR